MSGGAGEMAHTSRGFKLDTPAVNIPRLTRNSCFNHDQASTWQDLTQAPASTIPSINIDGTTRDKWPRPSFPGTIRSSMSRKFPAMVHSLTG